MNIGGFKDREVYVNLTTGNIEYRPINEGLARKYIGGRGLGVKYVFDNGPQVKAFSEDNILCLMTGPVTGSRVAMSGRLCFVTKSPLTETVTDSHMGGWTAARLKWAGIDNVIFRGKSDRPVYLYIENGQANLRDATDLWGLGTRETIQRLKERYGENDLSVACIGIAGENKVLYAGFINEHDRSAGRGGTGAVAGDKKLKAIVIRASQKGNMPTAANEADYKPAVQAGLKAIMESPVTAPRKGGLSVYGTNVLTSIMNEVGGMPAKNSQYSHFEGAEGHSGETVNATLLVSDNGCHACPVTCKKEVEVKEGKYKTRVESFEYETGWALGSNCGLSDARAIAYMLNQCNEYGFDTIEIGNALSVTMEAYQRGLIDEAVQWGDADKMIELIDQAARREGVLGNAIADGAGRAALLYGAPDMAMVVKNQAIPAYDPRGAQGIGLGYATSNRGACHLRGYIIASEILGIPEPTDRLKAEGKGTLLKIFQDLHAFSDSMNICKFSAFAENADLYADQYAAMTGIKITADDVLRIGERVYNLERYYNNLSGFNRRQDDMLPKRFLEEPASGNSEGQVCHLDVMLDEYYGARGWKDGVVPEEKLRELEII
ncbi:aldehyde ferredoxin oxidoreductase family protein [Ammoniphilus sp. YIM 78166]|uniref:aldehyde ferredoxin oxidoreductase family protein n=1 Tax=Ammoniphilus sp. YIM 78166 TaxID=1644106 RepID=UPI00107067B4|nr:aldehyde ferredoxin oxidoreductase family protein [Ammoniphilus sp. YIM 78166]